MTKFLMPEDLRERDLEEKDRITNKKISLTSVERQCLYNKFKNLNMSNEEINKRLDALKRQLVSNKNKAK